MLVVQWISLKVWFYSYTKISSKGSQSAQLLFWLSNQSDPPHVSRRLHTVSLLFATHFMHLKTLLEYYLLPIFLIWWTSILKRVWSEKNLIFNKFLTRDHTNSLMNSRHFIWYRMNNFLKYWLSSRSKCAELKLMRHLKFFRTTKTLKFILVQLLHVSERKHWEYLVIRTRCQSHGILSCSQKVIFKAWIILMHPGCNHKALYSLQKMLDSEVYLIIVPIWFILLEKSWN